VDGTALTQPLTLKLDPRVKTSAASLTQLATLTRSLYDNAVAARAAYTDARALVAKLDQLSGDDVTPLKAQVEVLAPAPASGRGGRGGGGGFPGGRGGAPSGPATLESASNALFAAAMAMQDADVAPTAGEVAAATRARTEATEVLRKWTAVRTTGVAAFNAKRKAAGQPGLPNG
jgi:hypothetical protein